MTARIVNSITRAPLQHIFYAHPRSADAMLKPDVPGQLWERVAGAQPVARDIESARRITRAVERRFAAQMERYRFDDQLRMQGAPVGDYGTRGPRVYVDGAYTNPRHAAGIIRSGQRIR